MRILWVSDAPWATSGYSVETALTVPRLARLGHDVAMLATFGLHGAVREWEGLKVYPGGADSFANDVIGHAARDHKADIVITLKDSFVFRPDAFQGLRWFPMTPVDHEPLPPPVAQICHAAERPIAYAPNGFRELRKAGFDPLYAPHGYDPATYFPSDKAQARKALGLDPSFFIVGTVAVNRGGIPSRKAWPQNLEAFKIFAQDKPLARYLLHTDIAQDGYEGGINLAALAAQLGISEKVMYCDQTIYRRGGFPTDYMQKLYASLDVLNAVSLGEGFGIPQLEAQACGTPVIASNFAAARDLCFGGWHVDGGVRFYDGQGAWTHIPDPEHIAGAMEGAYKELPYPAFTRRREDALTGAAPYQIDRVVAQYWAPLLNEIGAVPASRGVLRIVRPEEVLHNTRETQRV
jgi:glycosyltransferase involved in cell wall biosynthesis